jgi:predicted permease
MGVVGRPVPANRTEYPEVRYAIVSPAYFDTLKIPVRRGRAFATADAADSEPVALLNETAARMFFPDADPLGSRVWLWEPADTVATIVGVVGDIRVDTLRGQAAPTVFVPSAQASHGLPGAHAIMLRTRVEPLSLAAPARAVVQALDRNQPVERVATLEELLSRSLGEERFNSVLVGVFSLVALLLSALGTYGVISFSVARQSRDIGVRVALGARDRDVARLLLRQVMAVVAVGIAAGLIAALLLAPALSSLLYEVGPNDPWTLVGVIATLLVVSLAACAIPARRALAIDPTEAMRAE